MQCKYLPVATMVVASQGRSWGGGGGGGAGLWSTHGEGVGGGGGVIERRKK